MIRRGEPRPVWGNETVMLPMLGLAPPIYRSGMRQAAIDTLHHTVHPTATGIAYEALA